MLVSRGGASTCVSGELLVPHQSSEPVPCSLVSFSLTRASGLLEGHWGKSRVQSFPQEKLAACREPWGWAGSTGVGAVGSTSHRFMLRSLLLRVLTDIFPMEKTFLSSLLYALSGALVQFFLQ